MRRNNVIEGRCSSLKLLSYGAIIAIRYTHLQQKHVPFSERIIHGIRNERAERGRTPEKLAKTAEVWLASEKTLSLQMLEEVEARGFLWDSHIQGEKEGC